MLQSFTLSYPDSSFIGPKVIVLFTNFSKFEHQINDDNLSYDDEDDEEEKEESKEESKEETKEVQNPAQKGVSFETYVEDYKDNLVN